MSYAAHPVERFASITDEDLKLKKFLIFSLVLHFALVLWIAVFVYLQGLRGPQWGDIGGTDGSVNVKLVGAASGIPMPTTPAVTESKTIEPTKSLYKEDPAPKPVPEPKTPTEKIAPFKEIKPKPVTPKSKIDESKVPPPDNAVGTGRSGAPDIPTGYAPTPGGGSGPVTVKGQGGGDFASRYGWYVESVKRNISQNWLQSTIDPSVRAARQAKCVMSFRILRDGSITNVQMAQTSGNLSMDNSARRALDGIRFGPLPNDFNGSGVDVIFDFDLSLTH
ncbi:MAG: TonB family protein [Candidatus Acidiferrum sp.]|jgi:TonB family protein